MTGFLWSCIKNALISKCIKSGIALVDFYAFIFIKSLNCYELPQFCLSQYDKTFEIDRFGWPLNFVFDSMKTIISNFGIRHFTVKIIASKIVNESPIFQVAFFILAF